MSPKKVKNNLFAFAALFFQRGAELLETVSGLLSGNKVLKIKLESKPTEGGEKDEHSDTGGKFNS